MNFLILIGVVILAPIAFVIQQKVRISQAKTDKENFEKYDELFKFYSEGYDWKWLKAIATQESSLGQNSRVLQGQASYDGLSYGLMQIAEGVGSAREIEIKGFGGKVLLNDPAYSIKQASKLISYLNNKYAGDQRKVFLAYNQGENNTDRGRDFTKVHNNGQSYADLIENHLISNDIKEQGFLV